MTFYDLTAETPQGATKPLSDYKGKVVLVVNTATQCGLAPQFEGRSRIEQHKLVYGALGAAVGREIHALALHTKTPGERT